MALETPCCLSIVARRAIGAIAAATLLGVNLVSFSVSGFAQESDRVASVLRWMDATRQASGKPPTDLELSRKAANMRLTHYEFVKCWQAFKNQNRAIVTKEELLQLTEAKRAAIHDVRCKYRFQRDEANADKPGLVTTYWEENTFLSSASKVQIQGRRCAKIGPGAATADSMSSVFSYDGECVRHVTFGGNPPNASIRPFEGRSAFFRVFDVFALSMLLDSSADLQLPKHQVYDLVEMLKSDATFLLQQLEEVDGRKCLILTEGIFRVYLDVEHDFSVLKFEQYEYDTEPTSNGGYLIVGFDRTFERKLEEMVDHGNGLWLPSQAQVNQFKHGRQVAHERTEIQALAINEGVDEKLFSDVIPVGAIVFDGVRKASYTFGAKASIEGTLGDAVGQKRPSRRPWALIISNIFAIILLGLWFWRRKSRNSI
jgi:hypothetical protein